MIDQIFANLYNIPVGIRIACKMIELLVRRKFASIDDY
jgi:hypothetical protein